VDFRKFKGEGHWPTLLAAFIYFDVSFMVWVTLGPLMTYISRDLGISLEEKFSLIAVPILSGALLRVPLGLLSDRVGAKKTGTVAQLIVIAAVAYTWLFGLGSVFEVKLLGIALGFAGASFAVALPQASRWYPPRYQGLVMGIAGAGNVGVVLDTMTVPWLAETYGWQAAFGFLLIPLVFALVVYVAISKEAPGARTPVTLDTYREVLSDRDCWWFMFFYAITFGGFVGLANALPLYFTVHYHASGITAGLLVALVVAFGSLFRPVGGYLADRIGGIRTLLILFGVVAFTYGLMAFLPAGPEAPAGSEGWALLALPAIGWIAVGLFSGGALALGMGNGAVFQLIPLRFRNEIGVVTGLVGAAGGCGGFLLAKTLGLSKGMTGGFEFGFLTFAGLAAFGLLGLAVVKIRWRTTWGAVSGAQV
jgi:NNP family nitrate/nitrite transporter-like MFS transporter